MMLAAENLLVPFSSPCCGRAAATRAPRIFLPPFDLWNERFDPGRGFGSLSISKRIAPASGATSTSLTSTRSAS